MSRFRETKSIEDQDRFTVEDSYTVRELLASGRMQERRLTPREQEAIRRLYRTWQDMTS